MSKIKIFIIGWLLFGGFCASAQSTERSISELKLTLEQLNNAYLKIGPIQSEVIYYMSDGDTSTNLVKMTSSNYVVDKSKNYMKQESIEIVKNGSYNVMIDHEKEVIAVEKNLTQTLEKIPFGMLDSMLKMCKKAYKITKDGKDTWIMELKDTYVKKMELTLDPKTMKLSRINIFSNPNKSNPKGQVLRLEISSKTIDRKISDSYFDEKKFVIIDKNGKVNLQKKYKSYRLLTPEIQL